MPSNKPRWRPALKRSMRLLVDFTWRPIKMSMCSRLLSAKEMNIDYVIPLHCTGEPFYDKARAQMPGKVLRSYTGTRFVFS